jgi:hypothetical protein
MKQFSLVLLCLISSQIYSQQEVNSDEQRSLIPLYDSIDSFIYNTENNTWSLWTKIKDFEYNDKGDNLSQTKYLQINGAWTGETRSTYTYNEESLQLTSLTETFSFANNRWENTKRGINTYTSSGSNTNTLTQKWTSDQWVNYEEKVRIFDSAGNQIEYRDYLYENFYPLYYRELMEYNSLNLLKLKVTFRFPNINYPYDSAVFYYDNQGRLNSKVYKFFNEFGENDSIISTYTYNQTGYVDTILIQGYDFNGLPEDRSLDTYTYDEQGNQVMHLLQYKSSGIWKDQKLETRIYNNEGYLLNQLGEFKSWGSGNWWKDWEYKYRYDGNNLKISKTHFSYDSYDHSIHLGDSTVYYIQGVLGRQEAITEEQPFIYPNPSHGIFTIGSTLLMKNIIVYNSSGVRVYYLAEGTVIDIEKFPAGIYLLSASYENRPFKCKLLKL